MKRLLDHNDFTGITTYHEYDHVSKETKISYEADVEDVLEANKARYNDGTNGYESSAKEWKLAARIPPIILTKWLSEEGIDWRNRNHWPAIKRKLNSSEYLYLRTSPGRI